MASITLMGDRAGNGGTRARVRFQGITMLSGHHSPLKGRGGSQVTRAETLRVRSELVLLAHLLLRRSSTGARRAGVGAHVGQGSLSIPGRTPDLFDLLPPLVPVMIILAPFRCSPESKLAPSPQLCTLFGNSILCPSVELCWS